MNYRCLMLVGVMLLPPVCPQYWTIANAEEDVAVRSFQAFESGSSRLFGATNSTFAPGEKFILRIEDNGLELNVFKYVTTENNSFLSLGKDKRVARVAAGVRDLWRALPLFRVGIETKLGQVKSELAANESEDASACVAVIGPQNLVGLADQDCGGQKGFRGVNLGKPYQPTTADGFDDTEIVESSHLDIQISLTPPEQLPIKANQDKRYTIYAAMPGSYWTSRTRFCKEGDAPGDGCLDHVPRFGISSPQTEAAEVKYVPRKFFTKTKIADKPCDKVGEEGSCSQGSVKLQLIGVDATQRVAYIIKRLRNVELSNKEITERLIDYWATHQLRCSGAYCAVELNQGAAAAIAIAMVDQNRNFPRDDQAATELLQNASTLDPSGFLAPSELVKQFVKTGRIGKAKDGAIDLLKRATDELTQSRENPNPSAKISALANFSLASRTAAVVLPEIRAGANGDDIRIATGMLAKALEVLTIDLPKIKQLADLTNDEFVKLRSVESEVSALMADEGHLLLKTRLDDDLKLAIGLFAKAYARSPNFIEGEAIAVDGSGASFLVASRADSIRSSAGLLTAQAWPVSIEEREIIGGGKTFLFAWEQRGQSDGLLSLFSRKTENSGGAECVVAFPYRPLLIKEINETEREGSKHIEALVIAPKGSDGVRAGDIKFVDIGCSAEPSLTELVLMTVEDTLGEHDAGFWAFRDEKFAFWKSESADSIKIAWLERGKLIVTQFKTEELRNATSSPVMWTWACSDQENKACQLEEKAADLIGLVSSVQFLGADGKRVRMTTEEYGSEEAKPNIVSIVLELTDGGGTLSPASAVKVNEISGMVAPKQRRVLPAGDLGNSLLIIPRLGLDAGTGSKSIESGTVLLSYGEQLTGTEWKSSFGAEWKDCAVYDWQGEPKQWTLSKKVGCKSTMDVWRAEPGTIQNANAKVVISSSFPVIYDKTNADGTLVVQDGKIQGEPRIVGWLTGIGSMEKGSRDPNEPDENYFRFSRLSDRTASTSRLKTIFEDPEEFLAANTEYIQPTRFASGAMAGFSAPTQGEGGVRAVLDAPVTESGQVVAKVVPGSETIVITLARASQAYTVTTYQANGELIASWPQVEIRGTETLFPVLQGRAFVKSQEGFDGICVNDVGGGTCKELHPSIESTATESKYVDLGCVSLPDQSGAACVPTALVLGKGADGQIAMQHYTAGELPALVEKPLVLLGKATERQILINYARPFTPAASKVFLIRDKQPDIPLPTSSSCNTPEAESLEKHHQVIAADVLSGHEIEAETIHPENLVALVELALNREETTRVSIERDQGGLYVVARDPNTNKPLKRRIAGASNISSECNSWVYRVYGTAEQDSIDASRDRGRVVVEMFRKQEAGSLRQERLIATLIDPKAETGDIAAFIEYNAPDEGDEKSILSNIVNVRRSAIASPRGKLGIFRGVGPSGKCIATKIVTQIRDGELEGQDTPAEIIFDDYPVALSDSEIITTSLDKISQIWPTARGSLVDRAFLNDVNGFDCVARSSGQ